MGPVASYHHLLIQSNYKRTSSYSDADSSHGFGDENNFYLSNQFIVLCLSIFRDKGICIKWWHASTNKEEGYSDFCVEFMLWFYMNYAWCLN